MNNPDTLISVLLIASISLDVFSSFQDWFRIMLNYELHLMLNYEIQFLGKKTASFCSDHYKNDPEGHP